MSEDWLRTFCPNCEELLDLLLPEIDDGMLLEVARADYGKDVEEHYAPLKLFRDARVPPVLNWCPGEVLELIRWSEPDQPDWKPGSQGRRGHLLRAFACYTLLRSYAREDNQERWVSFNETVVQLSDSLNTFGDEFITAGAKFFAWCLENLAPLDKEGIEGPFFGLALLSLAIQNRTMPDRAIVDLCLWINAKVELLLTKTQSRARPHMNWLLSLSSYDQRDDRWIEIGRQLREWAGKQPESEKTTWVALIGDSLSEGQA